MTAGMTQQAVQDDSVLRRRARHAYATTVLSYRAANSDVAAAACRLNVHPNTCRYRLARAEEFSGVTFGNPDERLLLWLQLSDQLGA